MSSKQTIFCFGSNQNKPKLDLFRSFSRNKKKKIFGFFRNKPKREINTLLCNGHGPGLDMDKDANMDMDVDIGVDMDMDMDVDLDMEMEMNTDSDMIFCFGSNRNNPKLDLFRSFS